jgi:hypothetical protein
MRAQARLAVRMDMLTRSEIAVEHLLACCYRVETAMAAIYWFLAELHKETPEMAALWRKTAGEEENHARQFEFALKFPSLIADLMVKAEDVDRLLAEVLGLGAAVRADKPSAADALRRCIALERRLADYHMNSIGIFHDSQMQKVFEAMMAADREHVQALVAALDRLAPARPAGGS